MKDTISLPEGTGLAEVALAFGQEVRAIFHRQREESQGNYYLGLKPAEHFVLDPQGLRVNHERFAPTGDPLKQLESYLLEHRSDQEAILDRAFGYLSYDIAGYYEALGRPHQDPLKIPDAAFYRFAELIELDPLEGKLNYYQTNANLERVATVKKIVAKLEPIAELVKAPLRFTPDMEPDAYQQIVRQAKAGIQAGDCFQVVPSQRFSAPFSQDALTYFLAGCATNAARYHYYFVFPEVTIVGYSPETLVEVAKGTVKTNPIAGTRKRGRSGAEDQRLANELLADPKEVAEHQMLVDLGRNDIGRVASIGTVAVTKYLTIERYQHVMHIVSVVEGKLASERTPMDAVKALLPAGTVSGAPKIRAMQRLYEWEPVKRSIYAGAIGYLDPAGPLDFAIAIRTLVIQNQTAYAQAGAGVVYDSIPEREYQETLAKTQLFMEGSQ